LFCLLFLLFFLRLFKKTTLNKFLLSFFDHLITVDYWWENGRFHVSASCVTISNLDMLSSITTGVNPGTISCEKHLCEWARCQKAIGGIYFTKKWRAETLQPGFEFDNFKPRLKSGIFKFNSWLTGSFFGGDDRDFLKEGVTTYLITKRRLLTRQFFFLSSLLYSRCWYQCKSHISCQCTYKQLYVANSTILLK
jgi:hypothetical protein